VQEVRVGVSDAGAFSIFLLGLLGTGHCLGMCGPLVVALPGAYGKWSAHLIYHAGRLTTYALVGALLGGAGGLLVRLGGLGGDAAVTWTIRLQTAVSALAAAGLVGLGLMRLGLLTEPRWLTSLGPRTIPGAGLALRKSLNRENRLWLFCMGLILGLLPCGLSYAAFTQALASRRMASGAGLALIFGLGTLPGLLALGSGFGALWRRFQPQAEMVSGLLMIGMALSLIADAWRALF
jgi:sulfite exporter TauE/SafE